MNSSFNLSFIDFLSNMLTCFVALFMLSMIQLEEVTKGNVDDKSEFIIEMTWDDSSPNDIDLWVENPNGDVVWFKQKDVALMTLDRDQQGYDVQNEVLLSDGRKVRDVRRREVVNIRGIVPGEYTVNAVCYSARNSITSTVKITVRKLNPYSEIYEGEKILEFTGDEKTFLKFTVAADGSVSNIDVTAEKSLVEKYALTPPPGSLPHLPDFYNGD